jgi:hypothetical protein
VDISVTFHGDRLSDLEGEEADFGCNGLEKYIKLYTTNTRTNMNLFDETESLKLFETAEQIIEHYYLVRYKLYQKRKDYLIQMLGNILKQMSLKIQLKQVNNYISIYSDTHDFSLMTDYVHYKNNILSAFGFENGVRCLNGKNFISTMSCDLRSDKTVLLYLLNVNRTKPFCKLNMTSRKVTSFCTQLTPPLKYIDRLDIEFRDSKGNSMHFAGKHVMLDFTLKSIETELTKTITDAPEPIKSTDLYDQISNLMDN